MHPPPALAPTLPLPSYTPPPPGRAAELEKLVQEGGAPSATFVVNPDKPRKGTFEVRRGNKTYVSLEVGGRWVRGGSAPDGRRLAGPLRGATTRRSKPHPGPLNLLPGLRILAWAGAAPPLQGAAGAGPGGGGRTAGGRPQVASRREEDRGSRWRGRPGRWQAQAARAATPMTLQQGKARPAACCADPHRCRQPAQLWLEPSQQRRTPVAGPPTGAALLAG